MSKSNLISDLTAPSPAPAKQCGIQKIRAAMNDDERAALDAAVEHIREKNNSPRTIQTSGYTYKWLTDVLVKHEYDVTLRMVEKHTRRMCGCDDN